MDVAAVAPFAAIDRHRAEVAQSEVGDLQHEPAVDDAVGTPELAVRANVAGVQVGHPLRRTSNGRYGETINIADHKKWYGNLRLP